MMGERERGEALRRLLTVDSASYYAAADLDTTRRVSGGASLLAAGLVLAAAAIAPPTAHGALAGWSAVGGVCALGAAGAAIAWLRPSLLTPDRLLIGPYIAALALGLLTWLSGGYSPFLSLFLPLFLVTAASHPPRRSGPFAIFALLVAGAPLLYAPWDAAQAANLLMQALLWIGMAGLATALIARVRAQRGLLRDQERAAHRAARTDPLTGLGNRRALIEAIAERLDALGRGETLVLALFDLDGFKHYNDAYGHPAGDALLRRLAGRLGAAVAPHGRAYRMGGDEFCVLTHRETDPPEAPVAGAAEALTERGEGFSVACSHGAVALPEEATDSERALRLADQRLYLHKHREGGSGGRATRNALLQAMRERHPALGPHGDGVADLAEDVARAMDLPEEDLQAVRQAAALHDIGKVAIPDAVLDKPGPLDEEERAFVHRHPLIGERILAEVPTLQRAARIVRASHESWDGGGYPDGLAGRAIPLGARVVAVCDAYDAIVSDRPYRAARTPVEALAELRRCSGRQFDPDAVEALTRVIRDRRSRRWLKRPVTVAE